MGTLQCGKSASVFRPSCPIFVSPEISGASCELVLQAVPGYNQSINKQLVHKLVCLHETILQVATLLKSKVVVTYNLKL